MPGLVIDVESRKPALGFGSGGMSGGALLPIGVLATWKVYRATKAPIIGAGGIASATDALQYIIAGATAFAIGTAALRDPRLPERLRARSGAWCEVRGVNVGAPSSAARWSGPRDAGPDRRARCADADRRSRSSTRLGDSCGFYKVGGELFTAAGSVGRGGCPARRGRRSSSTSSSTTSRTRFGRRPVARRRAARPLITVHAIGGRAMLEAAVEGAGADCGVLAVTVLTSLDDLGASGGAGEAPWLGRLTRSCRLADWPGMRGRTAWSARGRKCARVGARVRGPARDAGARGPAGGRLRRTTRAGW